MTRIGLLSDTHGYFDPAIEKHFAKCDEIWHAGDWGVGNVQATLSGQNITHTLSGQTSNRQSRPTRGVYGNIDDNTIRSVYPEQLVFTCEEVKVMIRHIGGYPPRYNPETKKELLHHRPQLFISGHSHILRVMYDEKLQCLHMNPGAAGKQGWHKVRTLIRFVIDGKEMKDCEVVELGLR